jgi:hypothetical protein
VDQAEGGARESTPNKKHKIQKKTWVPAGCGCVRFDPAGPTLSQVLAAEGGNRVNRSRGEDDVQEENTFPVLPSASSPLVLPRSLSPSLSHSFLSLFFFLPPHLPPSLFLLAFSSLSLSHPPPALSSSLSLLPYLFFHLLSPSLPLSLLLSLSSGDYARTRWYMKISL